jgi:hypothetical protein
MNIIYQNGYNSDRRLEGSCSNMSIHLMKKGYSKVTARGILFKGNRFTCPRAIREQWFEKAAFEREWKVKIVYYHEFDPPVIYIADDVDGLEACNLIHTSNPPSDIKLQLYFQSIQNLKALRKMLYKNNFYKIPKQKRWGHGRIN